MEDDIHSEVVQERLHLLPQALGLLVVSGVRVVLQGNPWRENTSPKILACMAMTLGLMHKQERRSPSRWDACSARPMVQSLRKTWTDAFLLLRSLREADAS